MQGTFYVAQYYHLLYGADVHGRHTVALRVGVTIAQVVVGQPHGQPRAVVLAYMIVYKDFDEN